METIKQIISSITQDNINSILSGFAGAFFAYLFMVIKEKRDKKKDRFKKHLNSLIYLERYLAVQLQILMTNTDLLIRFQKLIQDNKIITITLQDFNIRDELADDCMNKEIINEFLDIINYLNFLNINKNNLIEFYNGMIKNLQMRNITSEEKTKELKLITSSMNAQFNPLIKNYKKSEIHFLTLIAKTRTILYESKSLFQKVKEKCNQFSKNQNIEIKHRKRYEEEYAAIEKEIQSLK